MVQLAMNRETQECVAIKYIARGSSFASTAILRELQNHRLCHNHPHIIQLRVRRGALQPQALHFLLVSVYLDDCLGPIFCLYQPQCPPLPLCSR